MLSRLRGRLYGYACFRNFPDSASKRGAKQLAVLLVSNTPHMDMWRPFLVTALDALALDTLAARRILESLRHALNVGVASSYAAAAAVAAAEAVSSKDEGGKTASVMSFDLWGRIIDILPPVLTEGEFGGASLKDLVHTFRERTMLLWRAVLGEARVLVCLKGGSSFAVTALVLATPALVGELAPLLLDVLEPYVTLAVVDRLLLGSSFVAGCNNPMFAERREWWDVLADPAQGTVWFQDDAVESATAARRKATEPLRRRPVSGMDMAFISKVLHGMHAQGKGETWIRSQFHDYTLSFLNRVGRRESHMDALAAALAGLKGSAAARKANDRFAEAFASGSLWKRYQERRDAQWRGHGVLVESTLGLNVDASPSSSLARVEDRDWDVMLPSSVPSHAPYTLMAAAGGYKLPTGFVRERAGKTLQQRVSVQQAFDRGSVAAAKSSPWIKVVSGEGEEYFWNVHSGKTSWTGI